MRIKWIKAGAGRLPGHEENFGQMDTIKAWKDAGLIEVLGESVNDPPAPVERGPMSHRSMATPAPVRRAVERPQVHRAIRAPFTKGKKKGRR